MTAPQYLCLAGPTASGKTAAALAIAQALEAIRPVEIVSVDSALVYRGMDIGTAKPSPAERAQVAHHLIDIVDPAEAYSAARFVADATQAIVEIAARGRLPLLVGGTMLYFNALLDGLDAMPAADAAVRAALNAQAARDGWAALHAELATVDPRTAARLAPGDSQRIQRALEVWRVSGVALSAWQTRRGGGEGSLRVAATEPPPTAATHPLQADTAQAGLTVAEPSSPGAAARPPIAVARPPLIALEPRDRAWLHARIDARFASMLEAGLVDEVRALRLRSDLHAGLPSMRAVGYRQTWAALDAVDDDGAGLDGAGLDGAGPDARRPGAIGLDGGTLDALRHSATAATRQLAKRQLTWLRGMPWRHRIACDDDDAIPRTIALALDLVGAMTPPQAAT